jgi:acetyl-CoA synthetase
MAGIDAAGLAALGLPAEEAERLSTALSGAQKGHDRSPAGQESLWREFQRLLLQGRYPFPLHERLYRLAYEGRSRDAGPGPSWFPTEEESARTNLAAMIAARGLQGYEEYRLWGADRRLMFWGDVIKRLDIPFKEPPTHILDPSSDATHPDWLGGASLNIADACFLADPGKTALLHASETDPEVRRITYGGLRRRVFAVADGLLQLGLGKGSRVALYLPMAPESVAAYLGVIHAGGAVVGIADATSPPDLRKRLDLGGAALVFTADAYVRDGKEVRVYAKAKEAGAPRCVVLPSEGSGHVESLREGDLEWREFLGSEAPTASAACAPGDATNILFSSGTTKDPKAIPWTHTTPIKAAADAHLHHDVHPDDVVAWPTSFGWMMGPWLTYGSLVNRAAMALYVGSPASRSFGEFVAAAGVTILGVVPKLVRAWREARVLEGLDLSRIRLFSSTAETSDPGDMLYLMHLAGYRPVIEYCGGTEIGGGYVTGTLLQPAAPGHFTTPALGLDFYLLDESGQPADRGEVGLVPPSLGLSTSLLNYDHDAEYFAGFPHGPMGEVLRRHGDELERLPGGFYRHLGRVDDMINLNGVKTSSEEIRHALRDARVRDTKPVALDVDGSGQRRLVVFAVPWEASQTESVELRRELRVSFERDIRSTLNPLLAHIHDVILVAELPQAGPGKTATTKEVARLFRQASASG